MNIEVNIEENIEENEVLDTKFIMKSYDNVLSYLNKINPGKNASNFVNSVIMNYSAWTIIIFATLVVSYPNRLTGLFTLILMILLSYKLHYYSHVYENIFTILHQYHHKHNNFFSHYSQLMLEFSIPAIFLPLYYYFGTIFFDVWTIILFALFYSTVHNINYGLFQVNKVHKLHHENVFTNLGPDICDIIFGTKNTDNLKEDGNEFGENISHYIPNIIIITLFILLLKYFCQNNFFKKHAINGLFFFITLAFQFCVASSLILEALEREKEDNDKKKHSITL
jgi:hypothetical protein